MEWSESGVSVAEGLTGRLRTLARSIDRLDRLESGSGTWLERFHEAEIPAAATELTLRAFRVAADPKNFEILIALSEHLSVPLPSLLAATGLTRLPLTERLNDMMQAGLATRLVDTDHAQITSAGAGIAGLVQDLIENVINLTAKE